MKITAAVGKTLLSSDKLLLTLTTALSTLSVVLLCGLVQRGIFGQLPHRAGAGLRFSAGGDRGTDYFRF